MTKKYKATRTLLVLAFVAALVTVVRAPQAAQITQPVSEDRIALYQALLDLQNPWTVMCVAAHPDDEDGTSLIVMRHKYGAHTVSLFSTFGEGGQNAIGPELYEELGAIRARETMAAAEIQGSEPHFLGLKDFGFSKTRDEAFKFWRHEEALRRMVLEIRKLRPDVIITNHSTTSNDHGQHQATALMVVEAFDAAADPNKFPEQLKDGVTTWQVQRLFVRARGNQAQQNPDRQGGGQQIVTIDPNEKDPIRGVVYAEEALRALQQHATQGPWPKSFAEYANRFRAFSGQSGQSGQMPLIRYALVREAKGAAPIPSSESHNFLDGLKLTESEAKEVSAPAIDGRPLTDFLDQPARILTALEASWKATQRFLGPNPRELPQNRFRVSYFIHHTNQALAALHGITTSLAGPNVISPGTSTAFRLILSNNGRDPITVATNNLNTNGPNLIGILCCPAVGSDAVIPPGQSAEIPLNYSVPEDARITVPHSAHLYDDLVFGMTVNTSAEARASSLFWVWARKWVDIAPQLEIQAIRPSLLVLTTQSLNKPVSFSVHLINHTNTAFDGKLSVANETTAVSLPPQAAKDYQIRLSSGLPAQSRELKFSVAGSASESVTIPVMVVDARVASDLRVGYIRGFDFSLPSALNALGVESKELSVDDVKTADLSKFTSVIVDNRVYESKPELIAVNQKLLDYANAGGNLIVFYHKSDEWNPDPRRNRPQLAPYKLILGGERVTDENAPITFLEPDHPLLNTPNKIGQNDFKDWIQERGLYYPREWDPQFHALLQSNDPGEQALKGGLLVADYGKGHYIYTSMVWYRELRGGIPGAYRMLANMISYGRN
jgi:LmbE family N-acetylglucosaminyl deacetylase